MDDDGKCLGRIYSFIFVARTHFSFFGPSSSMKEKYFLAAAAVVLGLPNFLQNENDQCPLEKAFTHKLFAKKAAMNRVNK